MILIIFLQLGIPFPWDCRRLSRQILTELNIAQLQVIVNDLHTQIEGSDLYKITGVNKFVTIFSQD